MHRERVCDASSERYALWTFILYEYFSNGIINIDGKHLALSDDCEKTVWIKRKIGFRASNEDTNKQCSHPFIKGQPLKMEADLQARIHISKGVSFD